MAMQMTFQEICAKHEAGFVCDEDSFAPLTKREGFNDLVIKLASKCEMDLVFLGGAKCNVTNFSIDIVPEDPVNGTAITVTKSRGLLTKGSQIPSGYEAVAAAWQQCIARGYHGLHAITKLDASHMPDNECRKMYSFAQFINSVVHALEAHFMFLKANPRFRLNAMNLWETMEDLMMEGCYLVLVWQYDQDPKSADKVTVPSPQRRPLVPLSNVTKEPVVVNLVDEMSPFARKEPIVVKELEKPQEKPQLPVVQQRSVNKRKSVAELASLMKEPEEIQVQVVEVEREPVKRAAPATKKEPEPSGRGGKRGRRSIAAAKVVSEASADEEDEEISFKNKPAIMKPQVSYHPDMSPEKTEPKKSEPIEPEPAKIDVTLDDFTLGFEKPQVKSVGRKSTGGRKSLAGPDWPEEEKEDVLHFFDNLNPSQTEQSQIALTCKYASMKFSKELSSKHLYQWVQKKGREVNKTVTSYDLAESLHQETTLNFFHSLGTELSEASRVSFTCKFMQTQFGVVLTSKALYDWLNNKGKKSTKRR